MENQHITVEAAIEKYLADSPELQASEHAELRRFERWLGKSKLLSSLRALDIEHYAERFSSSDPDCGRKMGVIRRFLTNSREKGWTSINLAIHLKEKKGSLKKGATTRMVRPELAVLTQQGYNDVLIELEKLKQRRPRVLDEIKRAAADKDFRENAPLHAAREELGHIDGRVQELSAIAKAASIIGEDNKETDRVSLGDTISLIELSTGQTSTYTIVGPKEANPAQHKISYVSPLGRAVIGKTKGDVIEVIAPAGNRKYKIEEILNT